MGTLSRKKRGLKHDQSQYEKKRERENSLIPLCKPMLGIDEIEEIVEVLESGWVSKGPKAAEFEDVIEEYLDVNHAVAVTNCTSALHLALLALDISWGDNVIVADYTFPATAFAVRYCGAQPILCDIDPGTYNIDPLSLDDCLRLYHAKAVIVVHTFGQCANMDQVMKIARRYNAKVIEDAACALGAKYKGRFAGTLGDVGCFSLHARKGITTGEGGIVVTDDKHIASQVRKLSEFGVVSSWARDQSFHSLPSFDRVGYNYKMSDILAAVGVAQMRKIRFIIANKQNAAIRYEEVIKKHLPFLTPPYCDPDCEHVFQSYVALVKPEYKELRNWIINEFYDLNIQTNIGTYALHREPIFKQVRMPYPVADDIFERAIALPMYPNVGFTRISKGGDLIWEKIQKESTCEKLLKRRS